MQTSDIVNPNTDVSAEVLLLNSSLQLLVGILVLILAIRVFQRYLALKTRVSFVLFLNILFLALTTLSGGLQTFYNWTQYSITPPNILVVGLPLGGDLRLSGVVLAFGLVSFANIFMILFTYLVFQSPRKELVYSYIFLSLLYFIYSQYHGIFIWGAEQGFPPNTSLIGDLSEVSMVILSILAYLPLIINSYRSSKEATSDLTTKGFRVMCYGGLVYTICVIYFTLISLLNINVLVWSAWAGWLVAALLIYIGFLMPKWFQKQFVTTTE